MYHIQSARSVIEMVVEVWPVSTAALGEERDRVKFSVSSATVSFMIGMRRATSVSPGSKVTFWGGEQ